MKTSRFNIMRYIPTGIPCLVIVFALFYYIGSIMGVPQMLNTIMHTAHDLYHGCHRTVIRGIRCRKATGADFTPFDETFV